MSSEREVKHIELIADREKKNVVFWTVTPCGSCKNQRFGGKYIFVIMLKIISELRKTLALTSNCITLQRIISSLLQLLVTANIVPNTLIVFTLKIGRYVPPKYWFLQKPHGVTSQKTAVFIATAVKTSNLT
jgi:hypothetical protein